MVCTYLAIAIGDRRPSVDAVARERERDDEGVRERGTVGRTKQKKAAAEQTNPQPMHADCDTRTKAKQTPNEAQLQSESGGKRKERRLGRQLMYAARWRTMRKDNACELAKNSDDIDSPEARSKRARELCARRVRKERVLLAHVCEFRTQRQQTRR